MTMHCGCQFFLFLVLCAELAAGMALPTKTTDPNMQSVIDSLQVALKNYSSILKEKSNLGDLSTLQCTETTAHLRQRSTVTSKLSEYQDCAEKPGSFCPDVNALCEVIVLNRELLQHLKGSYQHSTACPSSSSSSLPDFLSIRKSIQCVDCWRKQVEALG